MGYNYCLVIASSTVKDQVISKLAEEALKVDVITGPDGKALVRKGNILLSYEGNACPYFEHDLPGKTLTLYIDGRDCSNFASGNWKLAKSYNASLTLNMGYKVLRSDLKNIEQDKDISKLFKRIERMQSSLIHSPDDDAEEFSFEVEIASEKDVLSAQTLAQCISDLATSLNKKEYEHYAAQAETGVSLPEQENRLRGYAQSLGMTVSAIYVEAGVSGGKPLSRRPKGAAMLAKAKPGDVIAVTRLDRFSRSSADALATIEELTKRNVQLHCMDMGGCVNSSGVGRLVFAILAAVSQMERERIGERVRDAKEHLRQGGFFIGGRTAAGHSVKDGKLVADPQWKKALKAMTQWRAENKTYRVIAAEVQEHFGIAMDYTTAFRILNKRRKVDATAL